MEYSRDQFHAMMDHILDRVPSTTVQTGEFQTYRDNRDGRLRVKATWKDERHSGMGGDTAHECDVMLTYYRGKWYAMMAGLISCCATLVTRDEKEWAMLILDSMRRAGIHRIIEVNGVMMTTESLSEYVETYPEGSPERPWTRHDGRR